MPTYCMGLLHFPRLHLALGKCFGVKKKRPKQSPKAAVEGTPAALIREVKATAEGKIVHCGRPIVRA
jgi:hypothetical protein